VDVLALEDQLHAARQRVGDTPPSHCEQAITLYKGPFLPADSHLDWVLTRRESLRSNLMRVIMVTGRHYEQHGAWERAIECFEKGLEIDRLAEVVYRHVMDCCREAGDYAGVARTYERCSSELRKNLGIHPSPETTAIYASIRGKVKN
jgi:DNA-binding SARP family transcriptional activator